jgi:hypothetical protein
MHQIKQGIHEDPVAARTFRKARRRTGQSEIWKVDKRGKTEKYFEKQRMEVCTLNR